MFFANITIDFLRQKRTYYDIGPFATDTERKDWLKDFQDELDQLNRELGLYATLREIKAEFELHENPDAAKPLKTALNFVREIRNDLMFT